MNRRIAFRGMDHSDSIEQYAIERLEHKIESLLKNERTPITVDLVLEAARTHHHHRVELLVKTPHYDLVTHHEGPDMYQTIDHVVNTMHKCILNEKEKQIDEHKKGITKRSL
jgi:ribosomal subunit interface protein